MEGVTTTKGAEVHCSYRQLEMEVESFVEYVQAVEFGNADQLTPS